MKMVEWRPGIWLANAGCTSLFEPCSRKKKMKKEKLSVREEGGKISGGRFGLGARVFDDEDGRHVATALTRRRRRPTRGRAELPV